MDVHLSLFPGIDFLGKSAEAEGMCVVRGPDVIWGGDVHDFHIPAGVFRGIFGGPPCQPFSRMVHLVRACGREPRHPNLIPEFERVVFEGQPEWFLMEEVPDAPIPAVPGYLVHSFPIDNRWVGGEQSRRRRLTFGTRDGRQLDIEWVALEPAEEFETVISGNGFGSGSEYYARVKQAVLSDPQPVPVALVKGGKRKPGAELRIRRTKGERLELMGFPPDMLDECPLTQAGMDQAIANGVPSYIGRAVFRAIKRAMGYES